MGLFSATEKQLFEHANRVHPVYFHYPFRKQDDVTDRFASRLEGQQLARRRESGRQGRRLRLKVQNDKGTLHLTRTLKNDVLMVEAKQYPMLRHSSKR